MLKVSVILPVYNVEAYLEECLDSIVNQSLEDIEILAINDCSTDASEQILKEYVKKYDLLRIINNECNRGLSYSRNIGIENANGKYLYFVDSDDMLQEGALQKLYEVADRDDLEGILFDADIIYETEELKETVKYQGRRHNLYPGIYNGTELFTEQVRNGEFDPCVWRQFWNKDFLSRNKITFYEGILHEDRLFSFRAILSAKRLLCINESFYIYRKREEAITTVKISLRNIDGILIGIREMLEFWNSHMFKEEVDASIRKYLITSYLYLRGRLKQVDYKERVSAHIYTDKITDYLYQILMVDENRLKFCAHISQDVFDQVIKYDHVIIYGAGAVAKELLLLFNEKDIPVTGFAVTNKSGNPKSIMGNRIYNLNELVEYKEKGVVVVAVSPKYYGDIDINLKNLGFNNVIHIL